MIAALGLVLGILASGLPPRTFFAGDSGVRLVAARNAIAHPNRPLDIDLPEISGQRVPWLNPFYPVREGRAHATIPFLFPLVSAPFIHVLGIRGAFVVPAAGFLLAVVAIAWAGVRLDPRRSWEATAAAAAACTPLLFYGLEFWEHAPAVGLAAVATALLAGGTTTTRAISAGGVLGLAVLLRPEAACYAAALLVGARLCLPSVGSRVLVLVLLGGATVIAPAALYGFSQTGSLLGGHLAANMAGLPAHWLPTRLTVATLWLVPPTTAGRVLCAMVVASSLAARWGPKRARGLAAIAAWTGVAAIAVMAARRALPRECLWAAAPALLLPLANPFTIDRRGRGFLAVVAVLHTILVVATAPNDGGAQWGPRYLLFVSIPLAVLAADVLPGLAAAGGRRRIVGLALVTLVVGGNLLTQRAAYRDLRGSKETYERIVRFIEEHTSPRTTVLTDLWWLDQVAAALYPHPTFLFTPTVDAASAAFNRIAREDDIAFVSSRIESTPGVFDALIALVPPGRTVHAELPIRTLVLHRRAAAGPPR